MAAAWSAIGLLIVLELDLYEWPFWSLGCGLVTAVRIRADFLVKSRQEDANSERSGTVKRAPEIRSALLAPENPVRIRRALHCYPQMSDFKPAGP